MSSGMWGADVAALRALAQQMDTASDSLRSVATSVGPRVAQSPWSGPDRSEFVGTWDSVLAPQLTSVADMLAGHAQTLQADADQQEQSSTDTGGPGGGGGPGGSGGGGSSGGGGGGGTSGGGVTDDPDTWWLGLPGWVSDAVTGGGLVAGFGDLVFSTLDEFGYLANAGKGLTALGTGFTAAGGIFSALTMADGIAEGVTGIIDGNGWAIADGAISTAIGGAGTAVAIAALASNPVGWGVAAGIGVAGLVWGGLNLLTPDGMETTEWIGGMASDAWNATTSFVGDVGSNIADGVTGAVDAASDFVDDVTSPIRTLFGFG